ncbi:MAG: hypothetical protein RL362_581 [Bacteroidota bacterium]
MFSRCILDTIESVRCLYLAKSIFMKKVFILVALSFGIISNNYGQSLVLAEATGLVEASLDTLGSLGELEVDWGVVNTTGSAVAVKARRNIIQEVPGSTNYFCWGVCYDETVTISSVSQTIQAADTNFTFYAHYLPHGNAGLTAIEYVFYLTSNSTDIASQTVRYCVDADCTLGTNQDNSLPTLAMSSSNPLVGVGSIQYHLNSPSGKMEIYNLMGQSVGQYNLTNNNGFVIIDAQDFASGQYVVSIINGNGQRGTLPLIIQ